jgi:F-type H+-transporting ATPase subunit delta
MQENITRARPYAVAAFEQARDEGSLQDWSAMLRILSLVVSDPQMQSILDNPRLNSATLMDVVLDICGNYLSDSGKNFVKVLVNTRRLSLVPQIYMLFEQRRMDAEGITEVEVVSAYPLEPAQQQKIADAMSKRLGKKIEISTRTDKSLIGGAVIRAGDSVIDASMRGRLKQLGNILAE